ncbi:MAG: BrnA antitoxin family protein [Desulfobaccales bacterium]
MRKEYDFSKAKLVVPPLDPRKTRITIRLDTEILKWFWQRVDEAGGGNYQTMINNALKSYIESEDAKTIRYPGLPHIELDERYQVEYEDKGLEFQGRGYYVRTKIRDLSFTGEKAA